MVCFSLCYRRFNNDTSLKEDVIYRDQNKRTWNCLYKRKAMKEKKIERKKNTKKYRNVCTCVAPGGNSQLFSTTNFPGGSHACTRAHASPVKLYGNFGAVALALECFV